MKRQAIAAAVAGVALLAAPAADARSLKGVHRAPTVRSPVEGYVEQAVTFWAARGVIGCETGITIERYTQPLGDMAQGGYCRVRVNTYWLPPNRWAPSADQACALVFHEVRHALPGGEQGGIDGHGHTETGLMAAEVSATPYECVSHRRALARRLMDASR